MGGLIFVIFICIRALRILESCIRTVPQANAVLLERRGPCGTT